MYYKIIHLNLKIASYLYLLNFYLDIYFKDNPINNAQFKKK